MFDKEYDKAVQKNYQQSIDNFFKDSYVDESKGEVSILTALDHDFQFCLGHSARWEEVGLSNEQVIMRKKILPTFVLVNLYCSSIELFARVYHQSDPRNDNSNNQEYFKESAIKWFEQDEVSSTKLWNLRNAIAHHYKLEKG